MADGSLHRVFDITAVGWIWDFGVFLEKNVEIREYIYISRTDFGNSPTHSVIAKVGGFCFFFFKLKPKNPRETKAKKSQ